jgi:hypothetical protein
MCLPRWGALLLCARVTCVDAASVCMFPDAAAAYCRQTAQTGTVACGVSPIHENAAILGRRKIRLRQERENKRRASLEGIPAVCCRVGGLDCHHRAVLSLVSRSGWGGCWQGHHSFRFVITPQRRRGNWQRCCHVRFKRTAQWFQYVCGFRAVHPRIRGHYCGTPVVGQLHSTIGTWLCRVFMSCLVTTRKNRAFPRCSLADSVH